LRWGESRRIFFSDLHKMVGISSVAFNLVLGFTGAYWNLTHVISHMVMGEDEEVPVTGAMLAAGYPLDAAIADARTRLPGFEANYVSLPWVAGGDVTLWGSFKDAGLLRSPYGSTATYDAQTGANKGVTDIRTAGLWVQSVDAFRPLHFGDFAGLPVQILWCLGGLSPGVLAVSGTCIWWLRRRKVRAAAVLARATRPEATAPIPSTSFR
ncbi:MAG: PepSY domain-containing protein, partial [Opitutaceae bacterium]|nr:PepSY domain-containing protein [Opitutaceae bacterium]